MSGVRGGVEGRITDGVIAVDVREEELVCSHHRALPLETGEPVREELAGSWD